MIARLKLLIVALVLLLSATMVGAAQNGPVTISFPWWVGGGTSGSDMWFKQAVDSFNEQYANQYKLDIEFLPGQAAYIEKMKSIFATGKLPPLVTLKRDPTLAQLWVDQDLLVDLTPYFDSSPAWQALSIKDSVELNTINGKLVAAPDAFLTPIGLFYNMELLGKAGVTAVPTTLDEFFNTLEKLKAAGIPAISLHTQDTGWSAMLVFESLLAQTPQGIEFMDTKDPDSFNKPFVIDALKNLQRVLQFTTADAIGAPFSIAANNFLSEKTAIMPNGPWMIADFRNPDKAAAGFGDKLASALYPGNVAVADTGRQLGEYAAVKGYSQEVTDGVVAFAKHMRSAAVLRARVIQLGSTAPNLALTDADKEQIDPLAVQLIDLVQRENPPILANFQAQWNSTIQNETIVQGLPQLALGNITPEEFAQMLTDAL